MANALQLGNQKCLINFDEYFQIRDVFYPYVGEENHLYGHVHKFGLYVDGKLHWTTDHDFVIDYTYEDKSLVGNIRLVNQALGVELNIRNCVHNEETVYLASFKLTNLRQEARTIKVFFRHDFHIYGHTIGDTAYFDPTDKALIHYKGRRYFWVNAFQADRWGWEDWACGKSNLAAGISTSIDAEDGVLSKNPVAHGRVDSTGGLSLNLSQGGSASFSHVIIMAHDHHELMTTKHWLYSIAINNIYNEVSEWSKKLLGQTITANEIVEYDLRSQYNRSILTMVIQSDQNGAIIASCDSHFLHGYDTYSYCWPRDGAFISCAFVDVGLSDLAKNFFEFCAASQTDDGYLLQKYNADGSYGSSWHPWVDDQGQSILPIQEDSTATVLWAIGYYGEKTRDMAWLKHMWRLFIKKAADFLIKYRDPVTKLPRASWDLWEERRGILTFTACSVIGGLSESARVGRFIGEHQEAEIYEKAAQETQASLLAHLYDAANNRFVRMLYEKEGILVKDLAIDASLLAPIIFNILPSNHPKVVSTARQIVETLSSPIPIGGVARYNNDDYFRIRPGLPSNPWIITTMWLAQWYIEQNELEKAEELLHWVASHQSEAGFLPEQLDPVDGTHLSVSPLTWSHGEYVRALLMWIKAKYGMI